MLPRGDIASLFALTQRDQEKRIHDSSCGFAPKREFGKKIQCTFFDYDGMTVCSVTSCFQ
jgi:hypothetical protein